ncbi:MAG: CAP domain-containing protein [Dehalococcoidia bacterium]|nr:CAP domain-containing protein [Dehalococcoidia bacterium]
MLDLINKDRSSAGLMSVVLGSNPAAQQHAEEMLKNSYLAHWGMGGLKPYMRYTLAGGTNYEAENGFGIKGPLPPGNYPKILVPQELTETERGLMNSLGHRDNILNKWHKKVNLGIACDAYTCAVVQQFEGDYVEFTKKPLLEPANGTISMAGRLTGDFKFDGIDIRYDRPTHPLTFGQLGKTYAYMTGKPVAVIIKPPSPGSYYAVQSTYSSWTEEISPYDIDPNTPRPISCVFFICPPPSPRPARAFVLSVPLVVATTWSLTGDSNFQIQADLR